VRFASWRLMLLRKKTSKKAMAAQMAYFVENEEGCVPAMSESVVTCEG